MSRATVELDFFGMDHHRDSAAAAAVSSSSKSQFQKFLHRQRSFLGVQNSIPKIKPEVLKSVISGPWKSFSVPSSPKEEQISFPALPVYIPTGAAVASVVPTAYEPLHGTTPMTIFYNGTVSVFDVPRDKAESILKLAVEGSSTKAAEPTAVVDPKLVLNSTEQQPLVDPLTDDLPIVRSKSLQRFLEKRKERLSSGSPYACQT